MASKRGQLVETRKRLLAQIKAFGKLGLADLCDGMDAELKEVLGRQIEEIEARIKQTMAWDNDPAATASILRSAPGIGPVVSTKLNAEIPELGQHSGEQAGARGPGSDRTSQRCLARHAPSVEAADIYDM